MKIESTWWQDHANLAALYEWLQAHDSHETPEVPEYLYGPWKWDPEWQEMQAEKAAAEADAKAREDYARKGADDGSER